MAPGREFAQGLTGTDGVFNSSVYVLGPQISKNQQDFASAFEMKSITHSVETEISSLLPSGPLSITSVPLAVPDTSESPQRETQGDVWPSFAGLAFARKADSKASFHGSTRSPDGLELRILGPERRPDCSGREFKRARPAGGAAGSTDRQALLAQTGAGMDFPHSALP